MEFISFPEANRALTAPAGMEETVGTLPVYTDGQMCVSCWQLSDEEQRQLIQNDGRIYLGVLSGHTQPPVFLSVAPPAMPPVHAPGSYPLTPEVEDGLRQFAERLPLPEYAGSRPTPGAVLLRKHPDLRGADGQPLDPDKLYFVSSPAARYEHLQNLHEAHRLGGVRGSAAYLQPYAEFLHTPDSQPAQ